MKKTPSNFQAFLMSEYLRLMKKKRFIHNTYRSGLITKEMYYKRLLEVEKELILLDLF
jgi:hypothetical protein